MISYTSDEGLNARRGVAKQRILFMNYMIASTEIKVIVTPVLRAVYRAAQATGIIICCCCERVDSLPSCIFGQKFSRHILAVVCSKSYEQGCCSSNLGSNYILWVAWLGKLHVSQLQMAHPSKCVGWCWQGPPTQDFTKSCEKAVNFIGKFAIRR